MVDKLLTNDLRQGEEVLSELVEQFLSGYRTGRYATSEEFVRLHPKFTAELDDLLPTLILLEKAAGSDLSGSSAQSLERNAVERSLPTSIGDYAIEQEIGRGGMGVIYKAFDRRLQRTVALKLLAAVRVSDALGCERFQQEARAASRLHHRHIVPVFSFGEHDGTPYYAMQLIDGRSLEAVLVARRAENVGGGNGGGADTCREAAEFGLQAAEALAYAHSQGIVHRDIKPSNLILDNDRQIWVTDFGLAKLDGADALTHTGDVVGTLRYLAPERLEGWSDRRSDIYSLGATLYEFVTLRPLFEVESRSELIHSVLHGAPAPPSKIARNIPRDFETIVLKALAKEPAARYHSAEQLAEDLQRFLADRPILSRRATAAERLVRWCRRNPLVASLTGTVAVLLVAAVVILAVSNVRIQRQTDQIQAALDQKNVALGTATNAVDRMLVRIADDKLSGMPRTDPLRKALLHDALVFYDGLLKQSEANEVQSQSVAALLMRIGKIQQELEQYADALETYRRAAAVSATISQSDPRNASPLQLLAEAREALAVVQFIAPNLAAKDGTDLEQQFREAIVLYDQVQSLQPEKLQPPPACLGYLADLLARRGKADEAIQVWRQSIARGQTFVERFPENTGAQVSLCWSCLIAADRLIRSPTGNYAQAELLLKRGAEHVAAAVKHNELDFAGIAAGRYAATFAQIHLGRLLQRLDRLDEAVVELQAGAHEMQALCSSGPWKDEYWSCLEIAQIELVNVLREAGKREVAIEELRRTTHWLKQSTAHLPDDLQLQNRFRLIAAQLSAQLIAFRQTEEAESLAQWSLAFHSQLESRLRATNATPLELAKWRLLYPIELLPERELAGELNEQIAPALRELAADPAVLLAAANNVINRLWEMRNARPESLKIAAPFLLENSPDIPETAALRLSVFKLRMFVQTYYESSAEEAKTTGDTAILLARKSNLYHHAALTPVYTQLIDVTDRLGETDEAIRIGRDAVARIESLAIRDVPSAFSYHHLGRVLMRQDPEAAVPILREAWTRLDGENQGTFALEAFSWELGCSIACKNPALLQQTSTSALNYLQSRYGDNALPPRQLCIQTAVSLGLAIAKFSD